jgi:hypothetical protein
MEQLTRTKNSIIHTSLYFTMDVRLPQSAQELASSVHVETMKQYRDQVQQKGSSSTAHLFEDINSTLNILKEISFQNASGLQLSQFCTSYIILSFIQNTMFWWHGVLFSLKKHGGSHYP